MSSKHTSTQILGLRDHGDEHTNAGSKTALDLLWGMFGVSHVLEKAVESDDRDVAVGLGSAAKVISAMLIDRISHERYVERPIAKWRPRKPDPNAPQLTLEQQARYQALTTQLHELHMEVQKSPRVVPSKKPKSRRKRKANGASAPLETGALQG